MPTVAGIDVSAHKLDVACLAAGQSPVMGQFEQGPAGHRKLVSFLKKRHVTAVVMEATGIYYLDAAVALDQAGFKVWSSTRDQPITLPRRCCSTARPIASMPECWPSMHGAWI